MTTTQRGQRITAGSSIGQAQDKWVLGETTRTCERQVIAAYPDIIGRIDTDYELGSVADTAWPYVVLQRRQVQQLERSPGLARVRLFYEQTEPDPDEVDPPPPDEITVDSSFVTVPIAQHPDAQEIGGTLDGYLNSERTEIVNTSDVPEALRGRRTYNKTITRVRVTKFAATEFGYPAVNVREDPNGNESELWLVTDGFNSTRGRFFTQTRVHSYDPDTYPAALHEVYES